MCISQVRSVQANGRGLAAVRFRGSSVLLQLIGLAGLEQSAAQAETMYMCAGRLHE